MNDYSKDKDVIINKNWFYENYKVIIAVSILFCIALGVRLTYQHKAIVRNYVISDAREYFLGAYNLCFFGVYSTAPPPSIKQPPRPNAGRTPGYSLFLVPFMYLSKNVAQFLSSVMTAQAILGAFTAVLSFLLARFALSFPWAYLVGILTAFSPHLVAMDDYLLTESLFTFVTIAATVVLVLSWRSKKPLTALFAGGLFGLSMLIRPSALLLGPFMALVYLLKFREWSFAKPTLWIKQMACFALGLALIFGPFLARNRLSLGKTFPESGRGWGSFLQGTYVNLTYKDPRWYGYPYRDDPEYQRMERDKAYAFKVLKRRFLKDPWSYIRWYAGEKILCSWRWDVVTGNHDVYVYPMIRPGFQVDPFLGSIHEGMKLIHWPLFWLGTGSLIILFAGFIRKRHLVQPTVVMPCILQMTYHAMLVTAMFPIPRYSIPMRPYLYILAVTTLSVSPSFMYSVIAKQKAQDSKPSKG